MNLDFMDRVRVDFDKGYEKNQPKTDKWFTDLMGIVMPFEDYDGNLKDEWNDLPEQWRCFFEYIKKNDPTFINEAVILKKNLLDSLTSDYVHDLKNKLAVHYREEEDKYENVVKTMVYRWNNSLDAYKDSRAQG